MEGLGESLLHPPALIIKASSRWTPRLFFNQWVLDLETGSGSETAQGIVAFYLGGFSSTPDYSFLNLMV